MPKKYIWNAKYRIQHRIERSQTTNCIPYNIDDTKSCELPKCCVVYKISCKNPIHLCIYFSYVFQKLCWFRAIKMCEWKKCAYVGMFLKSRFGSVLSNCLKYTIQLLCVEKQLKVFNTTYTIQSRVNCLNILSFRTDICAIFFWELVNKTGYFNNIVFILVAKISSKKVSEKMENNSTLEPVLLACNRNAKLLRLVGVTFDSKVTSLKFQISPWSSR